MLAFDHELDVDGAFAFHRDGLVVRHPNLAFRCGRVFVKPLSSRAEMTCSSGVDEPLVLVGTQCKCSRYERLPVSALPGVGLFVGDFLSAFGDLVSHLAT